jgi:orotidine-5'-phosphate decarboxylase
MNSQPANRDRLIIALDVATKRQALDLVKQLSGAVSFFKIGLQLYTALGPEIIAAVKEAGANIFLDLKLHDIPNTVARAVEAAGKLGVQMLTVHLSGGRKMIEAAVSEKSSAMMLLGVTVLTSSNAETLREIGIDSPVEAQVLRLASLGTAAQIDGFVASPQELKALRARLGDKVKLVIPGVRPAWSGPGDQKRFMTPRDALQNGADYLVIGRPITAHPRPLEAVEKILGELA